MARRRIEPWPIALISLLGAMIASSLAFYGVAREHPDPLVVANAYEAGHRFNDLLRAQSRADALGWSIDLVSTREATGIHVRVAVRDREGNPLAVDRVVVRRERPTEGGFDTTFSLQRRPGGYEGAVPLPRPGRWRLVVRAERAEDSMERVFPLRWR